MKYDGYVICYDLSFPLKDFYTLVPELTDILGTKCLRVCGMGHMGKYKINTELKQNNYLFIALCLYFLVIIAYY